MKKQRVTVLRYVTPNDLPKSLRKIATQLADDFRETAEVIDTPDEALFTYADIEFFALEGQLSFTHVELLNLINWLRREDCDLCCFY